MITPHRPPLRLAPRRHRLAAGDLPSCHGFSDWTVPKACPFSKCEDRNGWVWDLSKCAYVSGR